MHQESPNIASLGFADLPAALWQAIYTHRNSQQEVCAGMRVCRVMRAGLSDALQQAVVHETCWDQVSGESRLRSKLIL